MRELYYPSADGKTTVHAVIWKPEGKILGLVQIIHGMAEYAARYSQFAEYLAAAGYMVCAEDHLGHGGSVLEKEDLGWFSEERDYGIVLKDIRALYLAVKDEAGNVPYFVLGHSMGSFFCRNYIAEFGVGVRGAVIMGTGYKSGAVTALALAMTRLNAAFKGWKHRSAFIKSLAFGSYNKRFGKDCDKNAWLSVNGENVAAYNADELCGFDFTDNGYYVLFSVIRAACSAKTVKRVPKNLPVYFVSGEDDPVGDYGKGVLKSYNKFRKAGIKDIDITLYGGARHEILNDDCSEAVRADILAFFEKNRLR